MKIEYPSELAYKGYIGEVEYDPEAKLFYGRIRAGKDVVDFAADKPEEIKDAFKDSVDDYLEFKGIGG